MTAFMNQTELMEDEPADSSQLTCNAHRDGEGTALGSDGLLDYYHLQFEDLSGHEIDGHSCDVIFAEDYDGPVQRLVNPDGKVQYFAAIASAYGVRESPITSAATHTPTTEAAYPPSLPHLTLPERTSLSYETLTSHVTASPWSAEHEHQLRHRRHTRHP